MPTFSRLTFALLSLVAAQFARGAIGEESFVRFVAAPGALGPVQNGAAAPLLLEVLERRKQEWG